MSDASTHSARTKRSEVPVFVAKDGSEIRELMHPRAHGNKLQSLAEAIVPAGARTTAHHHVTSEEVYHILDGEAEMRLGDQRFVVRAGDTICIPPGTVHALQNDAHAPLRLLCCCAPPYSDEDTVLHE